MIKILFALLFFPTVLTAQNYSGEVKVPGKDSSSLYSKAKEWIEENKNSDDEPFTEDIPNGRLKSNGKFKFMIFSNQVTVNLTTYYILTISVRSGSYNYSFENIMIEHGRKMPLATLRNGKTREGTIELYKASGLETPSKKMVDQNVEYSNKVLQQFEADMERIINSIEEKMKS